MVGVQYFVCRLVLNVNFVDRYSQTDSSTDDLAGSKRCWNDKNSTERKEKGEKRDRGIEDDEEVEAIENDERKFSIQSPFSSQHHSGLCS